MINQNFKDGSLLWLPQYTTLRAYPSVGKVAGSNYFYSLPEPLVAFKIKDIELESLLTPYVSKRGFLIFAKTVYGNLWILDDYFNDDFKNIQIYKGNIENVDRI